MTTGAFIQTAEDILVASPECHATINHVMADVLTYLDRQNQKRRYA